MPYTPGQPFLVAAVQTSSAFLDREATVDRACEAICAAAENGARLVVFPEAFVPGYPVWVWSVAAGQTQVLRSLYAELLDQSVSMGDATVAEVDPQRITGPRWQLDVAGHYSRPDVLELVVRSRSYAEPRIAQPDDSLELH